jgi:hypothetical protein
MKAPLAHRKGHGEHYEPRRTRRKILKGHVAIQKLSGWFAVFPGPISLGIQENTTLPCFSSKKVGLMDNDLFHPFSYDNLSDPAFTNEQDQS